MRQPILDLLAANDRCVNEVRKLQRDAGRIIGTAMTTDERVIVKGICEALDALDVVRDHIILEAYQRDELIPDPAVLGPQT